jgi:hypothetical protein
MPESNSVTYRIQTHDPEFLTGLLSDGHQVLTVPISDSSFVRILFDASGFLVSAEEQSGDMKYQLDVAPIPGALTDLMMSSAPIEVHSFTIPRYGIAIKPHPEIFDEFLADPEVAEPDKRYRERTRQQIREWNRENRFVLMTWGKQYWMNADGSVFAT